MVLCVNSRGRCSSQSFAIHCKQCSSTQYCTEDRHYCADNACAPCRAILLSGSSRLSSSSATTTGTSGGVPRGFTNNFLSPVVRITLAPAPVTSSSTTNVPPTPPPQQETFHLHSDLIKKHSLYFTSLFSFNDSADIYDTSVTLSEAVDDPIAFRCFVEYIYCEDYNYIPQISPITAEDTKQQGGRGGGTGGGGEMANLIASLPIHAKCYALGERLMANGFKAASLSKMTSVLKTLSQNSLATSNLLPNIFGTAWIDTIVETIRIIYDGTHRPYKDHPSEKDSLLDHDVEGDTEMVQRSSGLSVPLYPQGKYMTPMQRYYLRQERSQKNLQSAGVSQLIESNCPARQVVANFAAVKVDALRLKEEFRVLVREYGEFAEDLMLEVCGAPCMR